MQAPSERDPLLANASLSVTSNHATPLNTDKRRLGPLEISNSNKYAILVGCWIGNFLGVCILYLYDLNVS